MTKNTDICDMLLIALRKIIRAIDLHSKQLSSKYGLTGPQMIVLKAIHNTPSGELSSSKLAQEVSLSLATITSIIDRLVEKGYVTRAKSSIDKRKTLISTTPKSENIFQQNPTLLQENFVRQFTALKPWEQTLMLSSLQRVADLMNAESIDAAPMLANADIIPD